jgi:DNA-binding Lrp family transcriptional regulator
LLQLCDLDGKILKRVLGDCGLSPEALATELDVSVVEVQERLRLLKASYITHSCELNVQKLGYRRIDLFIYTNCGTIVSLAKKLLLRDNVVNAARSVGEHTIDLRVEVIVKDNRELLNLLEEVKAMEGVRDVIWSEIVDWVGRKSSVSPVIIDKLVHDGN